MKGILVLIISVLLATSMLYQAVLDYRAKRWFIASLESVMTVIYTSAGVCAMWYFALNTIT